MLGSQCGYFSVKRLPLLPWLIICIFWWQVDPDVVKIDGSWWMRCSASYIRQLRTDVCSGILLQVFCHVGTKILLINTRCISPNSVTVYLRALELLINNSWCIVWFLWYLCSDWVIVLGCRDSSQTNSNSKGKCYSFKGQTQWWEGATSGLSKLPSEA